jgi:DNA-binding transcriptional MerR regulator
MFKIGEFARLGGVTVETLRHYDALGLLRPAEVDPFTGYRSYTAAQLQALNRILALKELGFSLEEVGRLLQDALPPDALRNMLRARLAATEREVEAGQARLERIRARLRVLDLEETMSTYEINLKPLPPSIIAYVREIVPDIAHMPERCGAMFNTVARWVAAHHLGFGPFMTIYHGEEWTGSDIHTECAVVLPGSSAVTEVEPGADGVGVRRLEGADLAASTIVTDDFYRKVEGLTPAYQALGRWIEANGYVVVGPPREIFYGSPEAGDLTAEIQFPVCRQQA